MKKKIQQLIIASCLFIPSVYGQEMQEVLIENFDDNSLNWEVYDGSEYDYSCEVRGGSYLMRNNSTENDSFFTNEFDYDIEKDFTIEAQLTFTETNGSLLFMTNFSDWESSFFGLGIRGSIASPVFFNGNRYGNGGAYEKNIENSDFQKDGNSINLKVECKVVSDGMSEHQEMTFYVNGTQIAVDNRSNMYESMHKFGFRLTGKAEVAVDYIKIYGTPVEVEVANVTEVASSPLGSTASGSTEIKTFKAGENIYAKVFLPESFLDIMGGTSYKVKVSEMIYVDGEKVSVFDWTMNSEAIRNQGVKYQVQIAPITSSIESPREAFTLTKNLVDLKPGVHDIKLVVAYQKVGLSMANTLGEVSFKFDNSNEAGREKFRKTVSEYRSAFLKSVKMPVAKMNNATIEANVKKAIIAAEWVQTPIKVVLLESDWRTVTDKYYGNILQRQINVAVVVKDANGFCTIFYPSVYQEHQGGGKYSSTITLGGIHKIEQDIDCGNVN